MNFFSESLFFGAFLTFVTFWIGLILKREFRLALFNPILISMILCMIALKVLHISYDVYYEGAKYFSYFLTPATIALAVPLYEELEPLKKNMAAIFAGIASGVLASTVCVLVCCVLFHVDHAVYVSLLPKSITTAIGMGLSEEYGGYVSLTVVMIILTGVLGNMFAPLFLKKMHITEPIAKGVAIGTASHAIGTTRAMEMGAVEGAVSSLSIVVAGILTVVAGGIFSQIQF